MKKQIKERNLNKNNWTPLDFVKVKKHSKFLILMARNQF